MTHRAVRAVGGLAGKWLVCCAGVLVSACTDVPAAEAPRALSLTKVPSLFESAVTRVQLQRPANAVLGSVTRVVEHEGRLLIVDGRAARRAFLYTADGNYVATLQSRASTAIADGAFVGDNAVIVRGRALEAFNGKGELVAQQTTAFAPAAMVAVGAGLCIHAVFPNESSAAKIHCFDQNLRETSSFGTFEPMLDVYPYMPFRIMAEMGKNVAAISIEESRLDVFDPRSGRRVSALSVPGAQNEWQRIGTGRPEPNEALGADARLEVRLALRRFQMIQSVGSAILLWEQQLSTGVSRLMRVEADGVGQVVDGFDWPTLFGVTKPVSIVGASANRVWAIVDEDEPPKEGETLTLPPPTLLVVNVASVAP